MFDRLIATRNQANPRRMEIRLSTSTNIYFIIVFLFAILYLDAFVQLCDAFVVRPMVEQLHLPTRKVGSFGSMRDPRIH